MAGLSGGTVKWGWGVLSASSSSRLISEGPEGGGKGSEMAGTTLLSRFPGMGGGGGGGRGLRFENGGAGGILGADPGASSKMLLPRAEGGGGGGRSGIAEPSEPA